MKTRIVLFNVPALGFWSKLYLYILDNYLGYKIVTIKPQATLKDMLGLIKHKYKLICDEQPVPDLQCPGIIVLVEDSKFFTKYLLSEIMTPLHGFTVLHIGKPIYKAEPTKQLYKLDNVIFN